MELLAATPPAGDEIGGFQDGEMLGHALPRHAEPAAEIGERLPVPPMETVEQLPAAGVGQGAEYGVIVHLG